MLAIHLDSSSDSMGNVCGTDSVYSLYIYRVPFMSCIPSLNHVCIDLRREPVTLLITVHHLPGPTQQEQRWPWSCTIASPGHHGLNLLPDSLPPSGMGLWTEVSWAQCLTRPRKKPSRPVENTFDVHRSPHRSPPYLSTTVFVHKGHVFCMSGRRSQPLRQVSA